MKQVGILGLPRSGKTTLFEILVQSAAPSARGDHVGVVKVPDPRVDQLAALFHPKKTTYAQVQFVDSAGVASAAGRAAGRREDGFATVRSCDALAVVVRDFDNAAVPAEGGVNAERDLRAVETELILTDLAGVETRIERIEKELRIGKKQGERELTLLRRCREGLEAERPLRGESVDAEEEKLLRGFQFLTRKPLLVVYNQDDRARPVPGGAAPATLRVAMRAHLEREIVALPEEERGAFRAELGLAEDGLSLVIRASYELLGLVSFFTVGPDEVRAWTLRRGQTAVDAAGEIHTDLARGFIRAEVIGWRTLLEAGGTAGARSRGILKLEGRDYVVQDGDCLEIRFNRT
jgi:GTP-binding protein YchF